MSAAQAVRSLQDIRCGHFLYYLYGFAIIIVKRSTVLEKIYPQPFYTVYIVHFK